MTFLRRIILFGWGRRAVAGGPSGGRLNFNVAAQSGHLLTVGLL